MPRQRGALLQREACSAQDSGRGIWGFQTHHLYPEPLRESHVCALGLLGIYRFSTHIF